MTDDLVAFLRARYAEEDEVIRKNRGDHGLRDGGFYPDYTTYQGEPDVEAADEYLQAFAPPRMAAELDAKRRILHVHTSRRDHFGRADTQWPDACNGCGWLGFDPDGPPDAPNRARPEVDRIDQCPVVRLLALPYADHPDCRKEWTP